MTTWVFQSFEKELPLPADIGRTKTGKGKIGCLVRIRLGASFQFSVFSSQFSDLGFQLSAFSFQVKLDSFANAFGSRRMKVIEAQCLVPGAGRFRGGRKTIGEAKKDGSEKRRWEKGKARGREGKTADFGYGIKNRSLPQNLRGEGDSFSFLGKILHLVKILFQLNRIGRVCQAKIRRFFFSILRNGRTGSAHNLRTGSVRH